MIRQDDYEKELKEICRRINKSFAIKFGLISAIQTRRCINKICKLNKKTKNSNINELVYVLGRTNLQYKKYCSENNYYTDPYVNKKIKEAYIKLSRKATKIKMKSENKKDKNDNLIIEYNSDRGSYFIGNKKGETWTDVKQYRIKNVKNVERRRSDILRRLNCVNFGINIFDELDVDKRRFYKVNPDIISILLDEGKIDYAKMYIKEVMRWKFS